MTERSPESGAERRPLQSETKSRLVAETFGLLATSSHVSLESEDGTMDIDLFNTPDDTVVISEEGPHREYVKETRLSIFGSGQEAEVLLQESITPHIDDAESSEELEARAASDQLQEVLGLGKQPADEQTVRWAVDLIQNATELGRSER